MTPKEKAKELIDKYLNTSFNCNNCTIPFCAMDCTKIYTKEAAECALIAVDEIIDNELLSPQLKRHYILKIPPTPQELEYWQEVKNELLKQQNN